MAIRPNPITIYVKNKQKTYIRNIPKALEETLSKELTQSSERIKRTQ